MQDLINQVFEEKTQDGTIEKWELRVPAAEFSKRVWQCQDEFSKEELNTVLQKWSSMVNDILICLSDEKSSQDILEKLNGDYYPLGDLVNFLNNIEIQVKE